MHWLERIMPCQHKERKREEVAYIKADRKTIYKDVCLRCGHTEIYVKYHHYMQFYRESVATEYDDAWMEWRCNYCGKISSSSNGLEHLPCEGWEGEPRY